MKTEKFSLDSLLRSLFLLLTAIVVSMYIIPMKYAEAAQPADWTTSYYVTASNMNNSYSWGYSLGNRDANRSGTQSNAVVLFVGAQGQTGGVWGASLFGSGYQTNSTIANIGKEFARGYYAAAHPTDPYSQLVISLSTNNSGSTTNSTAGIQWANIVVSASSLISAYSSQVSIFGGNDMEIGWNSASNTLSWVSGYIGVTGYEKKN